MECVTPSHTNGEAGLVTLSGLDVVLGGHCKCLELVGQMIGSELHSEWPSAVGHLI